MKPNGNNSTGAKERLKRSDRAARRQELEAVNNYTKVGHSPVKGRSRDTSNDSQDGRNNMMGPKDIEPRLLGLEDEQ